MSGTPRNSQCHLPQLMQLCQCWCWGADVATVLWQSCHCCTWQRDVAAVISGTEWILFYPCCFVLPGLHSRPLANRPSKGQTSIFWLPERRGNWVPFSPIVGDTIFLLFKWALIQLYKESSDDEQPIFGKTNVKLLLVTCGFLQYGFVINHKCSLFPLS